MGAWRWKLLFQWAEAHRLNLHHWFFLHRPDLLCERWPYLKSKRLVWHDIKDLPVVDNGNLGRLIPRYKIRTKAKVIEAIVEKMEEHADEGLSYSGKCYISNSGCYEDARAVADLVERKFPKLNGRVEIYSVGTTIGSHTGPGTVALFFWGDMRTA